MNMAADKKIPLLTEVYQPKSSEAQKPRPDYAILITPELIARVAGHVRPRLEAEITQSVLLSVRDALRKDLLQDLQLEIKNAQLALEANTCNFVDKTKADLKTELPHMYQSSAELVFKNLSEKIAGLQTDAITTLDTSITQVTEQSLQVAIEAMHSMVAGLQAETCAQIAHNLNQEMEAFQAQSVSQHQTQLAQSIKSHQTQLEQSLISNFEFINLNTEDDLAERLRLIQTETVEQMRSTLNAAIPSIYAAAGDEVKAKFADDMAMQSEQLRESFLATINADLPAVKEVMRENIQQVLATSLPNLELDLRNRLTEDIHDLLLKVKFVLPK